MPKPSSPPRQIAEFIPLDGVFEESPARPGEVEVAEQREELFRQRQDFHRACRAFEVQAEAEAQRLAEVRRQLRTVRDQLAGLIDGCTEEGCGKVAALTEISDALKSIL